MGMGKEWSVDWWKGYCPPHGLGLRAWLVQFDALLLLHLILDCEITWMTYEYIYAYSFGSTSSCFQMSISATLHILSIK